MARITKENVLGSEESVCPKCGNSSERRGGTPWWFGGNDSTEIEQDFYSREFDGSVLYECYTCPNCGFSWEVNHQAVKQWHTSDGVHRIKRHEKCPDIEWGEQTIETARGGEDRVYVEMICRTHHDGFIGVFSLGEPSKTWEEPE